MAENKTQVTDASVNQFLDSIGDETKRADSYKILEMMQKATKEEPKMWGSSIVGFGSYHYVYDTGREGDSPLTGFSPRKANLTLYVNSGSWEKYNDLLQDLGKYTLSKACLYIRRLDDVNESTLRKLITRGLKDTKVQAKAYAKKKAAQDAAKQAKSKT